jgi:thymidylate kinase
VWRFWGEGKSKKLASGGAVIAFVGAEATGKSTLVRETSNWLSKTFNTSSVHIGKPPSTALSFLPNLAVPFLRNVAPEDRTSTIKSTEKKVSLLYAVRSVLVARDRYKLAIKIRRQAANGQLVICDRYPSTVVGAMDSPRLTISESENKGWKNNLLKLLAQWEHSFYRRIPAPDIVFYLTVPLEVAIERNRQRQKKEDEDYVIRRHKSRVIPSYPRSKMIEIESNKSQSQTFNYVRRLLWKML